MLRKIKVHYHAMLQYSISIIIMCDVSIICLKTCVAFNMHLNKIEKITLQIKNYYHVPWYYIKMSCNIEITN